MSYPFVLEENSQFLNRYLGTLASAIFELLDRLQSTGTQSKLQLDSGAASHIEHMLFDFLFKICNRMLQMHISTENSQNIQADDVVAYIYYYFPDVLKARYTNGVVDLYQKPQARDFLGRVDVSRSELVMPVDKIQSMVSKDILQCRVEKKTATAIAALLQMMVTDILVFARRYLIELSVEVIGEVDVKTAISADRSFLSLFAPDGSAALIGRTSRSLSEDDVMIDGIDEDMVSVMSISTIATGELEDTMSLDTMTAKWPQAEELKIEYTDLVRLMEREEKQNVRNLQIILRLFKPQLQEALDKPAIIDHIFGNIEDVLIASEAVLSLLEDAVEAAEESEPIIGEVILDLAGEAVLDVYRSYASTVLLPGNQKVLLECLENFEIRKKLEMAGRKFHFTLRNYEDCFRYVLPRLLICPVQHCWKFFERLESLEKTEAQGVPTDDRNSLRQAISILYELRGGLKPYERILQQPPQKSRQDAVAEVANYGECLECWGHNKPLENFCSELIYEGPVYKYNGDRSRNRSHSDRHLLLFDTMLLLTKRYQTHGSGTSGAQYRYKVKEKLIIRNGNVKLVDISETEHANAFMIERRMHSESSSSSAASPNSSETHSLSGSVSSAALIMLPGSQTKSSFILLARTPHDKQAWMYHILWLIAKPGIDRQLDSLMNEPIDFHQMVPKSYHFSTPDKSNKNIIFEEPNAAAGLVMMSGAPPQIKGATLPKLIERLTYHNYSDTKFMTTFATTYRSFCKPKQLLNLLKARFRIPELIHCDSDTSSSAFFENEVERKQATELRKFRKEFVKPVQFRVLNFLRHWILNHSYDFTDDDELKELLIDFIKSIQSPHLKRWVSRLLGYIEKIGQSKEKVVVFDQEQPQILYFLKDKPIGLMTLHPVELARQVTLLEFESFSKIRPNELIGAAWTKSAKFKNSPNVMRSISFTNEFTFWLARNIVETRNFNERIAVCERIVEILLEFKRLNNFSGQFCVASAFNISPVHRLKLTDAALKSSGKYRHIQDALDLGENHNRNYAQQLRTCNPPCVPFLGMWLSHLLHAEEGNKDFLDEENTIVNFRKWRRTADFITEIQQYQNQPYCLMVEKDIRNFFENLNVRADIIGAGTDPNDTKAREDFEEYLYSHSLEIEPRHIFKNQPSSPPVFDKRFDFPLEVPPMPTVTVASTLTNRRISKETASMTSLSKASSSSSDLNRSALANSTRRNPVRHLRIPSSLHDSHDSSTESRGDSVSSSSLPSTPFPTPPSSSPMHHMQQFFPSHGPPPLPPRPSESSSASTGYSSASSGHLPPPPPPARPLPSPCCNVPNVASSSMAPPPPPPRPVPALPVSATQAPNSAGPGSAGMHPPHSGALSAGPTSTRFEYPTPPQSSRNANHTHNGSEGN